MSQVRIRDIFVVTTASALLLAIIPRSMVFVILFFSAGALLLVTPVVALCFAILFAEQRGTILDSATIPLGPAMKKIWLLSLLVFALVSIGLPFLGSRYRPGFQLMWSSAGSSASNILLDHAVGHRQ